MDTPNSCALNSFCDTDDEYEETIDPSYLKSLLELEELDLSRNSLAEWQDDRFFLNQKLKKLYLNSNSMRHLTQGLLDSFSRLKVLDISDNKFECDEFIFEFVNLTLIDPDLNVLGWNQGNGYICRNASNTNQTLTFRKYYDWFLENSNDEDDVIEKCISTRKVVHNLKLFATFDFILQHL